IIRPECLVFVVPLLLFFSINKSFAQFADDFSDGDFTSNPVWSADNGANWIVDSNQLRSNSSTASSSFYITTPSLKAEAGQWEFYVNLQFNTSSANFVDVYLIADQSNLASGTLSGYFVRIGGTPDEISLYKMVSGSASILINGADGVTNVSSSTLNIKVIRNAANEWSLWRDTAGTGSNYFLEGTTTDNTITNSSFFGIKITQSTSSFFAKHFFDNFYIGDIVLDTMQPEIQSITPISSSQLDVLFNEKVEQATAETASNYSVSNTVGTSVSSVLQPDQKTVRLTFLNTFPNATTSTLTVFNVKDESGNAIISTSKDFFYFEPVPAQEKDVIITEIMADPSPTVGLPDAEFIEIHNRSNKPFDLMNWKISDGSSTGSLPSHIIRPGEYVILTSASSATLFSSLGASLGVSNFPTLNNAGDPLELKDNSDTRIDFVNYSDAWYRDEDKRAGGYTLELIDLNNPCGESDNWAASEDSKGGSPGIQNSIFANKPDLTGPKLVTAIPTSDTSIKVVFNEKLKNEMPPLSDFVITPDRALASINFADATLTTFNITLTNPLQPGITYTLTANTIQDCNGNFVQSEFSHTVFGLPQQADSLDILINEILFNPRPNAVDFVEVYNHSAKFINLKDFVIANFENGVAVNSKPLSSDDFLFVPFSYLVLTENGDIVKGEYVLAQQENFFECSLPSFNDDEGSVAVVNSSGKILDAFIYADDYHSTFLKDDEGVSLERISFELADAEQNWKSAATSAGYATPGYVNSNSILESQIADEAVDIEPEIFKPHGGQPEFTLINYNFEQGGYVANISIYDLQGRLVKEIANNEILASNGFYRWDGDREDGSKARIGYYTVWFEVFNASGEVKKFRKRVVIAGF
ncbi:MAG: lamin tail domain-containing protein, partial [Flammeovirgaceae bacterium]|nr:lamin tail domain-containing protein [Flammeovirgaceae bacterium]